MAYGDKLPKFNIDHIADNEGRPLCNRYPTANRWLSKLLPCVVCRDIYQRNLSELRRWNEGGGKEGGRVIEDVLVWNGANPEQSE
jgi:hypothetical protein